MKSFAKQILVLVSTSALVASTAFGTTAPKAAYHCVNAKNQQVKGANTQAQCLSPYRWLKSTTTAQQNNKSTHKHARGSVATLKGSKTKGKQSQATDTN